MSTGNDDIITDDVDVYLVGRPAVVSSLAGTDDMKFEALSLRERADTALIRLQEVLQAVAKQTRAAASGCDWEVEVSGVFSVGNSILGGQMEFNATFRLSSTSDSRSV